MASTNLSPIMLDHLYSVDDNLKVGGPLLSLEDARENPIVGDEPSPETALVIDPASISRCCIEKGLFPAVSLFFQHPCSISKSWSEWVDHELLDPTTCNILRRAQVLDAIFLSKLWDIHIEAKMLRHVVRTWSTATHTFICSWGEFTPTLEDVANISCLPICGNRSPFDIALTPEEIDKLVVLRRGAPTSPSTSLRFSNWIQYFGDANRQGPCRLAAFIALWLGRFVLCDFSPDCLHEHVFPLALAIARGDAIPLAPMFLGHLYQLLDRTQLFEKNASGIMGVETFLNSGFLQVFLWEHFKGLDVHSLPHSYAMERADWGKGSYMPDNLPLVCRWFKRMQRKGQDFLKLLDSIENFVFRPYGTSGETFTFMSFYVDVGDTVEVPAAVSQGGQFKGSSGAMIIYRTAAGPLFWLVRGGLVASHKGTKPTGTAVSTLSVSSNLFLETDYLLQQPALQAWCRKRKPSLSAKSATCPLFPSLVTLLENFLKRDQSRLRKSLAAPKKVQHRCRANGDERRNQVQRKSRLPVSLKSSSQRWHQVVLPGLEKQLPGTFATFEACYIREPESCRQGAGNYPFL
ncbi:uncharacterized protein Pyn_40689 [Prunus yedoensis var. nudiflora]|uniref:Aminotransferase-like plant mobile domain-containing protein n=1 Tax=Prunus yedoensis var. nudiflora TaxID=2094558 RepID=A0A314YQJ6_PRUYE|nr:uncharacterized protein Pyn_40689 [Prunus yedoensis var. nudiflora]